MLLLNNSNLLAQTKTLFDFGQEIQWEDLISKERNSKTIHWINVNTDLDTWLIKKDLLNCKGKPIGIVRSTKQYENFMVQVEWNQWKTGTNRLCTRRDFWRRGGTTTVPDTPRGKRSKSIENRAKSKGEWSKYTIVCIDGTIKLVVNGKFVNDLRNSTVKKRPPLP